MNMCCLIMIFLWFICSSVMCWCVCVILLIICVLCMCVLVIGVLCYNGWLVGLFGDFLCFMCMVWE